MVRFEEVQMMIAESAKDFLDIVNMQVFIEQFSLDREGKIFLVLPGMEPPFHVSATVSFMYDALQTGMALYEDEYKDSPEMSESVELDFAIKLPIMEGYPEVEELLEEISEEYPDTEPILSVKEIFPSIMPTKEYEILYSYDIDTEKGIDRDLLDEIFSELRGILDLVHRRTKNYINTSWYRRDS